MKITVTMNRMEEALAVAVQALDEATEEATRVGYDLAYELCPVVTGRLQGTLTVHPDFEKPPGTWVLDEGGPTTDWPEGAIYAIPVNFGRTGAGARPHFVPGTEAARAVYGELAIKKVRDALEAL